MAPKRQSDLRSFLDPDPAPSTSSSRATRSASTSQPPAKKTKVKRESPEEEEPARSESSDEDVGGGRRAGGARKSVKREPSEGAAKKKVKREPSEAAAGGGARRGVLREEETGILPPEMTSTPLADLYAKMREIATVKDGPNPENGCIVYWQRNKDLRLKDNTALSHASAVAKDLKVPLIVLHIFSPSDYKAHDRSPRRIDFQLRQMRYIQKELARMDIPLFTFSHPKRKEIPRVLCEKLQEWRAIGLLANLEYEVDELRRDAEIITRTKAARESGEGWQGKVDFFRDFCIVSPGELLTKQGKPYSVYSPFQRSWAQHINSHLVDFIVDQNPPLEPNETSAREHDVLSPMFSHTIPDAIEGFELSGDEEAELMQRLWPTGTTEDGTTVTEEILRRFLRTKTRMAMFHQPPLEPGAEEVDDPVTQSRVGVYTEGRNRVDLDGTSHISAYLAAGLVSPRDCIRAAYEVANSKTLPSSRDTGLGFWTMEIAWRDFYQHVLAAWPRVCMNKPWNLKYDGTVEWAPDDNDEKFNAWKEGRTGVPIVDAAMRSLNTQGYMHNRGRMVVASYLSKNLLLDWRKGEKYFMQQLIDGDLAQNNGGWAWASSVGCDPQPYFRIFNPVSQSEKIDPDGTYIKHWVPELRKLKGKAIHNPSSVLSEAQLRDIGYCKPIVDHAAARVKAIAVYKEAAQRGA